MDTQKQRVRRAFSHIYQRRIPRGELWFGTAIYRDMGLPDDLEGHLELCLRLGMDALFLPVSNGHPLRGHQLGYRYFSLEDVERASKIGGMFVGVIVDGPFQKMTRVCGLGYLAECWRQNRELFAGEFDYYCEEVADIVNGCIHLGVDAVVIADDLAWEKGTCLRPGDLRSILGPFYIDVVNYIQENSAYALFHSCGNITALLADLVSFGFDGLAGIQNRCTDLIQAKQTYGDHITLMAGIDADVLHEAPVTGHLEHAFPDLVKRLSTNGGFILCSSSGLYSDTEVKTVSRLYDLTDTQLKPEGQKPR